MRLRDTAASRCVCGSWKHCTCRYGQARRKGRMLVPKLDYLQYIVAKNVITAVGKRVITGWQRIRGRDPEAEAKVQGRVFDFQEIGARLGLSSGVHGMPGCWRAGRASSRRPDAWC